MDRQNGHSPITVFYSYAPEDERLQQELEKHLGVLRQKEYIQEFHARKIAAGADWKQAIDDHLSVASIILLLISPDFLASDYYYGVELQRAIELHNSGSAQVIPILLRPVDGTDALFEHLQLLPQNQKPVTSWSNRDEAFSEIAYSIRETIIHLRTQLDSTENIAQLAKRTRPPFERFSLAVFFTSTQNKLPKKSIEHAERLRRPYRKRRIVTNILILLLIVLLLLLTLSITQPSFCLGILCHSTTARIPTTTTPASVSNSYEFQNNDIKVSFSAFQSRFYILTETNMKGKFIPTYNEPGSISAISIKDHDTSLTYGVVLNIQSIYQGKYSIIINKIFIVVNKVVPIPRPLRVWETSEYLGYNENIYKVKYGGQRPGAEIPGENTYSHYGNVTLSAHDPLDHITVQLDTAILAYLQFQIQLRYYRTDISVPVTVTLPGIFGVVFSDATNWHQYKWQEGNFVAMS